jgi:hypothetical protein
VTGSGVRGDGIRVVAASAFGAGRHDGAGVRRAAAALRHREAGLGFGRVVASDTEVPNMLAIPG